MDTENNSFVHHVTGVSKGAAQRGHDIGTEPDKRERGRKSPIQLSKSPPVTTLQVSAFVWKKALKVSGGDGRRIQVIDANTVIVHNNPYSWR